MKLTKEAAEKALAGVVSHRETWIEIFAVNVSRPFLAVVSHRETWIEILKLHSSFVFLRVVSHRETWIEISGKEFMAAPVSCRLSQRDVD